MVKGNCKNCGRFLGENHKCPEISYYLGKHLSEETKNILRLIYLEDFVRFPNGRDKRKAKAIWEIDGARTKQLEEKGYRVIRLWENEIKSMNLNKFLEVLI